MKFRNDILALFTRAAAHKAAGEFDKVNECFLDTLAEGIPSGVRVLYQYANRNDPPKSFVDADHFDVYELEMEGQETQAMPVPLLINLDRELASFLFVSVRYIDFRRRIDVEWENWDEEDVDLGPHPLDNEDDWTYYGA